MPVQPAFFESHAIRRVYDEESETWWFSVVDIVQVLTQQPDYQTARKYWNKLKERLGKEGSQSVTDCHRLKLPAADGKNYLTDVASAETLLRLVQSVPSPKADLFDVLAHVAYAELPLTREERADRAMAVISENLNPKQRVFLDFVLSHYVAVGVEELDQAKLTPLLKLKYHDSISDAVADLGKPEEIGKVFSGFQKYLYEATA